MTSRDRQAKSGYRPKRDATHFKQIAIACKLWLIRTGQGTTIDYATNRRK